MTITPPTSPRQSPSARRCHCPCADWGHSVCDGVPRRGLPKYPHLEGWVALPCCTPCYEAITSSTDRRALYPAKN